MWMFLAAFAGASILGFIVFRRVLPRTGSSWEEWRDAEQIGGRWTPVIAIVSGLATAVALIGFGAPPWLRAALLGALVGFCLPFAVEGIRRSGDRG